MQLDCSFSFFQQSHKARFPAESQNPPLKPTAGGSHFVGVKGPEPMKLPAFRRGWFSWRAPSCC